METEKTVTPRLAHRNAKRETAFKEKRNREKEIELGLPLELKKSARGSRHRTLIVDAY